jgi:5-oxoprolinase (ATP-hydrolysing) subunit A
VPIDLNADIGESFGAWSLGADAALVGVVTSVNIACGAHAGDPTVLRRTLKLAATAGAAVGAHPGLPDLQGFGRREMRLTPDEVEDLVLYQVAALMGVARAEGVRVTHVKPHGALYHMAARDERLAQAIARAVRALDPQLRLVGLAGSALLSAAGYEGLAALAEGFADRAYQADGSLAPRGTAGAVLHDPVAAASQAVLIARDHRARAIDGTFVAVHADTLCIHGDTPGAVRLARAVRHALEREGIEVRAPGNDD